MPTTISIRRLAFALSTSLVVFASTEARAANCRTVPSESVVANLSRQAPTLRQDVLRLALASAGCASAEGLVPRKDLLTVIDYSMPSTRPRLFVFDMRTQKLRYRELVAHGKNSGGLLTKFFSNDEGSLATSIGLFVTQGTYNGSNGYSLRLRGLDPGFNDRAESRAIVMHGAKYVNDATAKALGRLGRSWGCPAVRTEVARELINTLKGGTPIFAYYPDQSFLARSRFIRFLSGKTSEPAQLAAN